jgi:galactose oxidase
MRCTSGERQSTKETSVSSFGATSPKIAWAMVVIITLTTCASRASAQVSSVGEFSPQQSWPYKGVHANFLPTTGLVLFSSSFGLGNYPNFWNPATGAITAATPAPFNIFCGGHAFLPDGTILWTGGLGAGSGTGVPNAAIFDPLADTWTELPNMNAGRWYPTNVTLANGDILTISGEINSATGNNPLPQVWQRATASWRDLTTAEVVMPLYPRMMLAPNGNVFLAGPAPGTKYLKTTGTGSWIYVSKTNFGNYRDYGSAVMYDVGKVLIMGGGDPPTNTAETINLNPKQPHWQYTAPMNYPRRQFNATILADGTVLVTGGSSGSGFDNSATPVLPTELWNPATGTWAVMASLGVYRGYHSTALLLPDGRVLSAGGEASPTTAEVYSPPYLFQGVQPTIVSAPGSVLYGGMFFVTTPDAASITQVSWVGIGSVTHAFNMQQRFISLRFKVGTNSSGDQGLNVTAPADGNVSPPGYYMLFILKKGVPSVAAIVQIG